jgi:hypothetical protein
VARRPYCAVRIVLALRPFPAMRSGLATDNGLAPRDILLVVRFTRNWIHYGFMTHTIFCVVIAAVEGLLGR